MEIKEDYVSLKVVPQQEGVDIDTTLIHSEIEQHELSYRDKDDSATDDKNDENDNQNERSKKIDTESQQEIGHEKIDKCTVLNNLTTFENGEITPGSNEAHLSENHSDNEMPVQDTDNSTNHIPGDDVTSDIGDEYDESDETPDENKPFLSDVYTCSSCGWKPQMDKCFAHRPFQQGFSNGVYQYQGIMPVNIHGYQNFNFGGYAAGQRPVYPITQPVHNNLDMRYNPTSHCVTATPANQNLEEYIRTIQNLRRRTFCLGILVIVLVFGVVTLTILFS